MRLITASGELLPPPSERDRRLIDAAMDDDAETLQQLIAGGADINTQDEYGMTPLHHAAATAARSCIRLLIRVPACSTLIRDAFGRYASELAIEWGRDYAVGRLLTRKQLQEAKIDGVPAYMPVSVTIPS